MHDDDGISCLNRLLFAYSTPESELESKLRLQHEQKSEPVFDSDSGVGVTVSSNPGRHYDSAMPTAFPGNSFINQAIQNPRLSLLPPVPVISILNSDE